MFSHSRKALCALLSLVLAVGLCPLPAAATTGGLTAAAPLQQAPTPGDESQRGPVPEYDEPSNPARMHTQSEESDFETAVTESGVMITDYLGEGGDVVIPAAIGGQPVVALGESAFMYEYSITSVTVPASVTTIGDECFCYCYNLAAVTLSEGVSQVGYWTFGNCTSLASIHIPDSVTLIDAFAFSGCTSLALVTGASGVEKIERRAFYGTAISSFPWGTHLEYISESAFDGCANFPNPDYPSYLAESDSGAYRAFDDTYILSGTADYKLADEVLTLANQERAAEGEAALAMDETLQAAAMKRACETSLHFSHTRPDGSSCFTAADAMSGENIAAGSSTARGVMNQWMNSPGHRANILTSDYQSIGIGCVRVGALTYWVQAFSSEEGSNTRAGSGTASVSYKTYIDYETISLEGSGFNLNEALSKPVALKAGKTFELSVGVMNGGWSRVYCPIDPATFEWTSSNTAVAKVSAKGIVTPESKKGTATITAKTPGGKKWSIKVKSPGFKVLAKGATAKSGSATYKVLNSSKRTVAFHKAPASGSSVKIPAKVVLKGGSYTVVGISKGAFANSNAKTVTVKTKKLTKKSVKGCFKKSKRLKTVKVAVGSKKTNRSYVKKYKALFKKSNSGASVTVK